MQATHPLAASGKAQSPGTPLPDTPSPDTVMESFAKGQGFGAGGRVTITTGINGEGLGTFGWGGAASTIGWVDRTNQIRGSGWIQLMTQSEQKFPAAVAKAVYGTAGA